MQANRTLLIVAVAAVAALGPASVLGYYWGYRTAQESIVRTALSSPPEEAPVRGTPARKTPPPAAKPDRPISGKIYLQLVAVSKDRSGSIIDALRNSGFPVVALDVPDKPELYRLMVGPLSREAVDKTRAELQDRGFPGDSAVEKIY